MLGGWRPTFGSLHVPGFRWFWFSFFASQSVWNMSNIARGWRAYDLTGSAVDLGLVTFAISIPMLLMVPGLRKL